MNKQTYKKIIPRTIGKNYKQFLLSIFIVFFASMILCGFMVNAKSFSDFVDTYFETTNLVDIILDVSEITDEDEAFFEENNISYKKRLYFESSVNVQDSEITSNVSVYVGDGKKISIPYIESGSKGILIDKNVYEKYGFTLSTEVLLFSFDYESDVGVLSFNFEECFSGTMSFVEKVTSSDSWAVFIDEERFLTMLNGKLTTLGYETISEIPYNQILIDTDNIQKTLTLIEDYYDSSSSELIDYTTQNELESVVLFEAEINQSYNFVYVFPIFFIIIAMLFIIMSTSELIRQETHKIGIQKSIGIPDKKIIYHYGIYGGLIGLVGSILGMAFGTLILPNIIFSAYNTSYTMPYDFESLNVPWIWIVIAIIVICLCGLISSIISAVKILKKTPIECLKGNPFSSKSRKIKSKKEKSKNCSLFLKLPFRDIRANPSRTIFASIGVAGVTALMFGSYWAYDLLSQASIDVNYYLLSSEVIAISCLKTFSVIITIIAIFNTSMIIINQKSKEMATLKLLGGKEISICFSAILEIILIVLFGLVLGLILSFPLMYLFLSVSGMNGISFSLSASSVLLPILVIIISTIIVFLYCFIKVIFTNGTCQIKNAE